MGNLFYRGQPISEICILEYHELKYWNGWHELMEKAEKAASGNKNNA
jgi:hypothetical protein